MSSFLRNTFLCCIRQKESDAIPDERSPLLDPVASAPPIITYDVTSADMRKTKEQLDMIVGLKQGKMVNVHSKLPFNLRNEPLGYANASSSRSNRSLSTNLNRHRNRFDMHDTDAIHNSSPSISRSESVSSMQYAAASQISAGEEPEQRQVIRARLIPNPKSYQRVLSRRGRSKTRQGRFTDDSETAENVRPLEGKQDPDVSGGDNDTSEQAGINRRTIIPLSEEDNAAINAISSDLSTTLKKAFTIQDVGSLSRSWGD